MEKSPATTRPGPNAVAPQGLPPHELALGRVDEALRTAHVGDPAVAEGDDVVEELVEPGVVGLPDRRHGAESVRH